MGATMFEASRARELRAGILRARRDKRLLIDVLERTGGPRVRNVYGAAWDDIASYLDHWASLIVRVAFPITLGLMAPSIATARGQAWRHEMKSPSAHAWPGSALAPAPTIDEQWHRR